MPTNKRQRLDVQENDKAQAASVDSIVIREFWIIQERIGFIPTRWRDVDRTKQVPSLRWDRRDAVARVAELRTRDSPMQYRIVRRVRHDFETDL